MRYLRKFSVVSITLLGLLVLATGSVTAQQINGQVTGAGAPIAGSTVTLWEASAGSPQQLAQTQTGADGRFSLTASRVANKDATLYLVAGSSAAVGVLKSDKGKSVEGKGSVSSDECREKA